MSDKKTSKPEPLVKFVYAGGGTHISLDGRFAIESHRRYLGSRGRRPVYDIYAQLHDRTQKTIIDCGGVRAAKDAANAVAEREKQPAVPVMPLGEALATLHEACGIIVLDLDPGSASHER